ncbi:PAS domain-containing protein [Telmatospirillum sp. J64-1]|uniref:PAS domain-containing protein n=1 Tax=Telmatospirillum sp. J64-1 TaxID=2502183 RepID=UPI00115F4435|nr:PAS domain-containing protein [Telmatospirillum sp. J64-1]
MACREVVEELRVLETPSQLESINFKALFDAAPSPHMLLDRELRFVWANEAYLKATSRKLSELLGKNIFEVFPSGPDDPGGESRRQLAESFERVLRQGKADILALIRYAIPSADGTSFEIRYWSATHTPIPDEQGRVRFILQQTNDVTDIQNLKMAAGTEKETLFQTHMARLQAGLSQQAQVLQEEKQSLETERSYLRELFRQAPGFVAVLRGSEHIFELANDAYLRHVGHRDLIGKPIRTVLPELVGQGYVEILDGVLESGRPFVGRDMRVLLREAPDAPLKETYADFVYQPIVGEGGIVSGIFVQGQDVTERRQSFEALRQGRRQLRESARQLELLNQVGNVITAELDIGKLLQLVTDAATELTGAQYGAFFYDRPNEEGKRDRVFYLSGASAEDFSAFPMPRNTHLAGLTFLGEGIVRSDDILQDPRYGRNAPFAGMPPGHLQVRSYLAIPVISRSGQVLGGLFFGHGECGVFDDRAERLGMGIAAQAAIALDNARLYESAQAELEERRQVQEALRASEDRFRTLANLVPAFVWFSRPDGRLDYLNDRWYGYTGQTPEQALPDGWIEVLHPDDRARVRATWREACEKGTPFEAEARHRRHDGEYRWYIMRAEPLHDERGVVTAWFGTHADIHDRIMAETALRDLNASLELRVSEEIAEREKAQAALLQAQKMEAIGQLTGGIAHDFNNLLQALSGCLNLVGRRVKDPAIEPLLETGRQAVDRGGKLTKQLMAFARRQALRPEAVDVQDAMLGMADLLGRALRADISCTIDLETELWPVEVDPTQFEMAILNLVVNARDAMPDGGSLRIHGCNRQLAAGDVPEGLEGAFVEITVADSGSGMTPEVLERAFEPFFTTKGVGKGSGLGLAQIYGFARQSGGVVHIDSIPGKGTKVRLLLPRSLHIPVSRPVEKVAVEAGGGRILMVEDDPIVGSIMSAALEGLGYDVLRATTADEAVEMLAAGAEMDLLFTDVVMPGERSGLDLARELRNAQPDLPVVLATGYSEEIGASEGFRVLAKPYRTKDLVEALETELARADRGR